MPGIKQIIDCEIFIKDLLYGFGNPRKTNKIKQEIEELKKSIQQFGIWRDIGIDENNNVIFGNKLSLALKELNIEKTKVKRLIGYTQQELKVVNIKDNEHIGLFDKKEVKNWLDEIKFDNIWENFDIEKKIKKEEKFNEVVTNIFFDDKKIYSLNRDVKFDSDNYWGIPTLKKDMIFDINIEKEDDMEILLSDSDNSKEYYIFLLDENFKRLGKVDINKIILCGFLPDEFQEKVWAYPDIYLTKIKEANIKYSFGYNFSIWNTDARSLNLFNCFRANWITRYLQEIGIKIIPDIRYRDIDSLNYTMLGYPEKIKTMCIEVQHIKNNSEDINLFVKVLTEMIKRFKIEQLIIYYGSTQLRENLRYFLPKEINYIYLLSRQMSKSVRIQKKEI